MRISVIGCGYVGLVTGACLAEVGNEVVCTDCDASRIDMLQSGRLPIFEPHLDAVIAANRRSGNLAFIGNSGEAIRTGDIIFICVGTPPAENGEADLSAIDDVARQIATEAQRPKLVVEKSTVPVQTGQQLKRALAIYQRHGCATHRVASNPEFLCEGTAVADFLHPSRIVVGVEDEAAGEQLRKIYEPILERRFHCPVHPGACPPLETPTFLMTTINSAELIKHASNSFLALKISYANLIGDLCERLGADADEVTRAMGMDPRIGPAFLQTGLGFGGFCLPKDVQGFIRLGDRAGVDVSLLKEVERVNKQRIGLFVEKIRRALWVIKNKEIGVLGLAFKPNTDDIRFAPSIDIISQLLAEGAKVRVYDPKAMEKTRAVFSQIRYCREPYEAARGVEAILIITEWEEFRRLDWSRIADLMIRPLILDGRNMLNPTAMKALGFEYDSFGHPDCIGLSCPNHSTGHGIPAGTSTPIKRYLFQHQEMTAAEVDGSKVFDSNG